MSKSRMLMLIMTTAALSAVVSTLIAGTPAGAATGSAVNITDPVTGANKAKVSSTGRLLTASTVSGSVGITGGVAMTAPAKPWNQINDLVVSQSDTRVVLYSAIGPARLALTSLSFAVEGAAGSYVRVFVIVYVSSTNVGDCDALTGASFGAAERFVVVVPGNSTFEKTWPSPLVYSAYASSGRKFCVDVEGSSPSGSYAVHLAGSGFII